MASSFHQGRRKVTYEMHDLKYYFTKTYTHCKSLLPYRWQQSYCHRRVNAWKRMTESLWTAGTTVIYIACIHSRDFILCPFLWFHICDGHLITYNYIILNNFFQIWTNCINALPQLHVSVRPTDLIRSPGREYYTSKSGDWHFHWVQWIQASLGGWLRLNGHQPVKSAL